MEVFNKVSRHYLILQRIVAFILFVGVFLCIYQPPIAIFKTFARYAPAVALSYWLLGLLFMALKMPRLTIFAFVGCAFLCLYLKSAGNPALVRPARTSAAALKIFLFNSNTVTTSPQQTLKDILNEDPDIIAVQEMRNDLYRFMSDSLKSLYPYRCIIERPDIYSMAFFSKKNFSHCDTVFTDNIPYAVVQLRDSVYKNTRLVLSYMTPPVYSTDFKVLRQHLDQLALLKLKDTVPFFSIGEFNLENSANEIVGFKSLTQLSGSRQNGRPDRTDGKIELMSVPTDHIFFSKEFKCVEFHTISNALSEKVGIVGVYQMQNEQ